MAEQLEDRINYFLLTTMEEDVLKVSRRGSCIHKTYEQERLQSLRIGLKNVYDRFQPNLDQSLPSHCETQMKILKDVEKLVLKVTEIQNEIKNKDRNEVIEIYETLKRSCEVVLTEIKCMERPMLRPGPNNSKILKS